MSRLPLDATPTEVANATRGHKLADFRITLEWIKKNRPISEYQNLVRFVNIMNQSRKVEPPNKHLNVIANEGCQVNTETSP